MVRDTTRIQLVFSAYARPTFFAVTKPDDDNHIAIVISCLAFRTMNVGERISYLFGLLTKHIPDILEDRLIIIQAYSPKEMEEVLDQIFIPAYEESMEEDE